MIYDTGLNQIPVGQNVLDNDIKFGTQYEIPIIEQMEKYFNEVIHKTAERYSPYDAYSENTKYEIKSRRNKYRTYPTTIVAMDKVSRVEGKLIFIFHFTDGLYYIKYDKDLFDTFETKYVSAYRTGGVKTDKLHYFIDIDKLTKIDI